jgi:endonuclease YncB( thermonuclease family)
MRMSQPAATAPPVSDAMRLDRIGWAANFSLQVAGLFAATCKEWLLHGRVLRRATSRQLESGMQNLPLTLLIGLLFLQLPPASPPLPRTEAVLVRAVLDGDTIDVQRFGRVRLLGIDAPEVGRGFDTSAPLAREARDKLRALVLGHWVRLETDRQGAARDAYNRRLAYVVREDGLVINTEMVREGLARVSARERIARLDELKAAEALAQALRRGMWSYTRPSP